MTVSMVVLLGAAVVVACATPLVRKLAHNRGFVDEPGGQVYKWHTQTTAYLGGIPIVGAVIISVFVSGSPSRRIIAIALGMLAMAILGLWDDKRPVSVGLKVMVPALAALLLWIAGMRVSITGVSGVDLVLAVVWVVLVTHSLNVIDNMNGVAVGLACFASLTVLAIALNTGQFGVAVLAAAVLGGCLGFLPFNFPRATVFLGDGGTLPLGFVLAALTLSLDLPRTDALARLTIQGSILAVPLFNSILVSFSRLRRGKAITRGGRDSLTYRLVALGFSRQTAAFIIWLLATIFSGVALTVFLVGEAWAWTVAAVCVVITTLAVWRLDQVPIETDGPNSAKQTTVAPRQTG